ncbi:hypothetical protein SGL43_06601 [Streptomyces globisporus]|uniref:Uncharacterized protein n=1 Tax=Streptomyces globisporus TaxID=1908 RepID=A0ABN8VC50_STRGL|nr:hypothetical protein [Streptomyces globisporus]CAH9419546.1 hypothetical protein SGL43_06601 [Streptomyces globisporus]
MTPPITPPPAPMSAADREAHEASSHVRRTVTPTRESITLPADPAARRRLIAQRRL